MYLPPTIIVVTKQELFGVHGHEDQTGCSGVLREKTCIKML